MRLYSFLMTQRERIIIFCAELQTWFSRHKRALPWRDLREKDRDHRAYLVLVSEVMLQQTQVSRVIVLYRNFLEKYPRIEDLAKATNAEILIAWRGLGYNNRALRLRDAARTIVGEHRGKFPDSMEALTAIKGIGEYTAGAVRNFAFDLPTPCLDVNIRRILHRFFVGPENPDGTWKKDDRYLLKLAEEMLKVALGHKIGEIGGLRGVGKEMKNLTSPTIPSPLTTSDFHAALMDFGSLVCTKNAPKWELLSPGMKSICKAYGKEITRTKKVINKEPGREVAGKHIPNRIFRGRVIEALRDDPKGLTHDAIGRIITPDWTMGDYGDWLDGILKKLQSDGLIEQKKEKWRLRE